MLPKIDFCESLGIEIPNDAPPLLDITSDSRKVNSNTVFFDFTGSEIHVNDALSHQAALVITPLGATLFPDFKIKIIQSHSVRSLFARACRLLNPTQPSNIAGITGTNGKSSTVDFLRQLWNNNGRPAVSIGTIGLQGADHLNISLSLTTPEPLSFAKALTKLKENGIDYVAFEASSHGIDQNRVDVATVRYAGFTNLSQDHLDYHHTMEAYFQAKARLFTEVLEDDGTAVINGDDPYGQRLITLCKGRGVSTFIYSIKDQGADLFATIHELSGNGMIVSITAFGKSLNQITIPVVGTFQVENVLCALGIALASTPLTLNDFISTLTTLTAPPGRMDYVGRTAPGGDVYVDYAHTPDALERALTSLRLHTKNKLYVIFGCGGDRDTTKRPLMGKIANDLADYAVVTDDNPRTEDPVHIRKSILAAAPTAQEIPDRSQAIRDTITLLREGDILLIAGKGHEQGQIIGTTIHPFCDKKMAYQSITTS